MTRSTSGSNFAKSWLICVCLLVACSDGSDTSPVLLYTFEDFTGTEIIDASDNNNDGHTAGAKSAPGVAGTAMEMIGTAGTMIAVPMSPTLERTGEAMTLSVWAYRENDINTALIAHAYPALFFGFHGTGFKFAATYDNGRGMGCYADSRYVAETETWYHMVATFNGWVGRLYVNGEEICSDWTRGGRLAYTDAPMTLGGYIAEDGSIIDALSGRMDEVRIYDRALSAEQVKALYGSSLKPTPSEH